MNESGIERLCAGNNIEMLVLFGSHSGGSVHKSSDIDLAVKVKRGVEVSKLDLIFSLAGYFGDREIDLVLLSRDTDPLLLYEIFMKGKLLFEAQSGIFENEKLRAWKLYLDTEKLRGMQGDYLKRFVEKMTDVA
jgi:predicted nucleotidyltransferase